MLKFVISLKLPYCYYFMPYSDRVPTISGTWIDHNLRKKKASVRDRGCFPSCSSFLSRSIVFMQHHWQVWCTILEIYWFTRKHSQILRQWLPIAM